MKKVFYLLVAFGVMIAGFSACNKDGSNKPETPSAPVPTVNYKGLTFISSGESTVCLTKVGTPYEISLEYSTDESQWNPYIIGEKIALADGTFLLFRAGKKNYNFSKNNSNYYRFEISGPISAQGNIMSLIDKDCSTPLQGFAFKALFEGCTSLLSAPELPETTLTIYCYEDMFKGCSSLKSAPKLPATSMVLGCYMSMFDGCTHLTSAPELPATELKDYCYFEMFNGCTRLTSAPKLPATTLADRCYTKMFQGCTNLTSAPELPAKELVDHCYVLMFKGCSKLRYVKALFTTEPSEDTTRDWLSGVAASGTFVKSKNATWNVTGALGIPQGWKIVTQADN